MLQRAVVVALFLASGPGFAVTEADIVRALQPQLADAFPDNPARIALKPLPDFVHNAACTELTARFRSDLTATSSAGGQPVHIQCQQPRVWSAYVSAIVAVRKQVLTACHSLPRNQPLRPADLCPVERSAATLRQHALHRPAEALGMSLKRPLSAGSVLYRSALTASTLIKRGEGLIIESHRGSAMIAVRGEALQAGSFGEQITVRNTQSGRKLAAWILAPGRVSASAPPPAPAPYRDNSKISAKVQTGDADTSFDNPVLAGHPMIDRK